MEPVIRIGIVDDDRMMMQGTRAWLDTFDGVTVPVAERSVDAFLAACPQVDVVLLDLALRDGSHAPENIRRLVRRGLRVLVVSDCGDLPDQVATLRAGAAGYLSKGVDLELLLRTAREVATDTHVVSAALAAALDRDRSPERRRIPERCREAVSLFVTGLSVREVAAIMYIAPTTVQTYIERVKTIYREAGLPASTRSDLRRLIEADAHGPGADRGPEVGADVLLVGGRGSHADLVAPALQRACGGRVTAASAVEATRELRLGCHDVVVVDLDADPSVRSRPPRTPAQGAAPRRGDGPLDALHWRHSGLDVVEAARTVRAMPEVVLWVDGTPDERLLLGWAAQELEVRAFCARDGGGLATLPRAVAAAARGSAYADRVLADQLPDHDAPRIADALLGSATRRSIWAALASGRASDKEIGTVTGLAAKTVRNHMVEMLRELQAFDPTVPPGAKPQTALLRWATEHRRFLLDAAVRRQAAARDDRPEPSGARGLRRPGAASRPASPRRSG